MIGTAAAIIGSAIIGAGASALSSSNAAKAAQTQANAVNAGTQASIAEQQREFNTIQANNAPFQQAGVNALGALQGAFGLTSSSAPSMTSQVASTPVPNAGGIRMTAGAGDVAAVPMDRATGVPDGSLGTTVKVAGAPSMTGTPAAASAAPQPDWDAYLAANPDVAARAQSGVADGSIGGPNSQWATPEQWAAYHYANGGQAEGRAPPPMLASTQAPSMTGAGGYVPPPGYTDPTAPNGYDAGARPDPGAAPTRPMTGPLNVGLDAYQESPDYNFRLQQGQNALDHTASSMGGIMSGARLKAAERYQQDYATTDYNNWRDYTTQQYNTQQAVANQNYGVDLNQYDATRARSDGLYNDDRSFLTNAYNTRTGQLLDLAGFGQSSTNATNQAGQNFATNAANLTMTGANATGNAAINSANAFTSGVNNLLTTGAYLGGKAMTSGYGVNPANTGSFIQPQSTLLAGGGMDFGNAFNGGGF